jgi:alpha-galactosidase
MTEDTRDILINRDVIAVDQDPLLIQGRALPGDPRVIVKRLADGAVAVALFNPDVDPVSIRTAATATGLRPANCYAVRDLWAHADTTTTGDIEQTVPGHGVTMLRVTPGCE